VPKAPGSLDEALDALEKNHEFLLRGDVFTDDVIKTWIKYKREKEVDAMRLRRIRTSSACIMISEENSDT